MQPLAAAILLTASALASAQPATKPVRVFLLAGPSNREGHGFVPADPTRNGGRGSPGFAVKPAATAPHFAPLVAAAGPWRTRDDGWISFLDRQGPLSVGDGARPDKIGPELGCGWEMGDALDEPNQQGYHWNSHAETSCLIGKAMGEAMQRLLGARAIRRHPRLWRAAPRRLKPHAVHRGERRSYLTPAKARLRLKGCVK